ncbi:hypothetical protein GQ44DRAFT_761783 [Phaeosphaeriaceae sp. PMI808]|nr:hypothetical protein GQ44DRAFT_761783 [Phaeosphaeriaceae sp. PMI808]
MMKSFYLLSLSILFAPILCGNVKFNGCSSPQEASLRNALRDVELISKAAADHSEGGRGKVHAWFGTGGKIVDEDINLRYHKFANILKNVPKKDVTFDCTEKAKCCSAGLGGVPACGDQPGDDFVNICRAYWSWQKQRVYELSAPSVPTNEAIDIKYRTQGYVLLHELLHSQYGARDVKDDVKDQFGKTVTCKGYGHYCVLKYAKKNADNARKNADTYALFALAAYYGIDKFQTNPDQLNR